MNPCPICGAQTPSPERILPLSVQFFTGGRPALVEYRCHGAIAINQDLLRFGVIEPLPWSCGNFRWLPWGDTTFDLRRRAVNAEQLRLALAGAI